MKRYVVIGGGVSGLAAAYRLQQHLQAGCWQGEILLLEASDRLGGVLGTEERDGFLLERGPDCFLTQKPRGLGLSRELGLTGELIDTNPDHRRSFILSRGKLRPVPEGFYLIGPSRVGPFLRSSVLSWPGKLRMMLEPFIPRQIHDDETLASFVRRRFGQEALERLAQPLVGGIYAADPETLSLRATFPQFLDMEARDGSVIRGLRKRAQFKTASGPRYSLFASFRRGMQTLTDQVARKLSNVTVRTGTRVQSIKYDSTRARWKILISGQEMLEADGIILALPAYAAADLLNVQTPELSEALRQIPYTDSITVHMAFHQEDLKDPLKGFGFVVPAVENRLLQACTFADQKFAGRAPEGYILLRIFLGGSAASVLMDHDDADLGKRCLGDLRDILGICAAPLFSMVVRHPRSLAQFAYGHRELLARIEKARESYSTLRLAGNWGEGVGVPDCIKSGEDAADYFAGS